MRYGTGVLALVLLGAALAPRAGAQEANTVVLGLRSVEGDDEAANNVTNALRTAARQVRGWKVVERPVSMSQMSLAHGCDDIDATCLSEIAKGLQADRLLFGTVRRIASQKNKYDFEVSVSLFNTTTRLIGSTETAVIPRADAKQPKALATRADPIIAKLSAADAGAGILAVHVNVPSAEVKLDGQVVGQTRDQLLVLEGLKEGDHRLEITAIGHLAHAQQVMVASGQRTELRINLEPVPEPAPEQAPEFALTPGPEPESSGSVAWLGYTLLGVGVASLAGWGVSMYMVGQTNKDDTFVAYKNAFPETADDVCDLADSNDTARGQITGAQLSEVKSLCSRGRTFNLLQWVFLGAGVLTTSVGTFILVSESGGSEEQMQAKAARPVLTLSPQFGQRSFELQTTLRF
jgi:hypothetical protein